MLRLQKRAFGQSLEPVRIWAHSPPLLRRFLGFQRGLERRSSPLDPALRALVTVQVSRIHHCAFCMDYTSYRVLQREKGSQIKLDDLDHAETSDRFSEQEKAALAYTDAVARPEREVDDALFARLQEQFSHEAIVELTALIGLQSLSASFNAALDIPSQGLCERPTD